MINPFSIEDVRNFWDGVALEYGPSNEKVGYVHTQRFEKAMEFGNISSGMRVLNIWSRTGSLIPYIRKVPNVILENREVSPRMIELARVKYPDENFGSTNLENLSEFADNSFDRIVSLETLEHTPKPIVFLSELCRVLKPGGLLIMSLPPKGAEVPEYVYKLFFEDHGEGPHNFLWPSQVKSFLKSAGLTLLAHKPFILLPLGSDSATRIGEKILTSVFGWTPLADFGVRHFYVCKK